MKKKKVFIITAAVLAILVVGGVTAKVLLCKNHDNEDTDIVMEEEEETTKKKEKSSEKTKKKETKQSTETQKETKPSTETKKEVAPTEVPTEVPTTTTEETEPKPTTADTQKYEDVNFYDIMDAVVDRAMRFGDSNPYENLHKKTGFVFEYGNTTNCVAYFKLLAQALCIHPDEMWSSDQEIIDEFEDDFYACSTSRIEAVHQVGNEVTIYFSTIDLTSESAGEAFLQEEMQDAGIGSKITSRQYVDILSYEEKCELIRNYIVLSGYLGDTHERVYYKATYTLAGMFLSDAQFDDFMKQFMGLSDRTLTTIDEMYEYFQDHSIWYRLDPDIVYDEPVESEEMEPEESVELAPTETTEGD